MDSVQVRNMANEMGKLKCVILGYSPALSRDTLTAIAGRCFTDIQEVDDKFQFNVPSKVSINKSNIEGHSCCGSAFNACVAGDKAGSSKSGKPPLRVAVP